MSLTDDDKQWLSEHFATLERLEQMETKLLTAFHGWGSAIETRVRSHTTVLQALDAELEYLKTRVKKLEDERRPPAA